MGDLGDRMKRYERASERHLTPRCPVIVRVDGRAFHTFTRGCDRPFDRRIVDAMLIGAMRTAADMQGFTIGYVQSDEASFLLTDTSTLETQPWFDYDQAKVVSIAASLMTAHFGRAYGGDRLAFFDARAFTVPADDVPNYFLWRMRDWERNSVQMLAGAHFSHRDLHGKKVPDMHEMLHAKGINWADLPAQLKNGTIIQGTSAECPAARWKYEDWHQAINGPRAEAIELVPSEASA